MNWNYIEKNWETLKQAAKQNWPNLNDEDLNNIDGKRDQLISTIQKKYFSSIDDAQQEVDDWHKNQSEKSNTAPDSTDPKYNPDYSGTDSNLTQLGEDKSNTSKINTQENSDIYSKEHDEKSKDQT